MKTYTKEIQRHFRSEWGYDICLWEGLVFGIEKGGVFIICNNLFRKQQSDIMVQNPHNILSKKDVMLLYKCPKLGGTTSRSFQCSLRFDVVLATAMRRTELAKLETNQLQKCRVGGEMVWVITGFIGCTDGICTKTRAGGVLQENEVSKEIIISD